ncbi:DNA adenine methylase [Holdemanella sp. SCCA2]|uniref:DNA adenine methylase n=1 Tax=uncultured Holdemanella sp. TaxID=1763549 RepID=UPI00258E75D0|nr:DNA adenine methylase [uncultured Holdemanella sp.]MCF7627935.1 DNA adenine methylase [Holdemanella sp. SCCA2]
MISKSPLRYPGGKVKLYPFMEQLIRQNTVDPPIYVEPFAGGAGLALELLFNGNVERIMINDLDPAIYSFWYSITNEETFYLFINRVNEVDININEWKIQKDIYMHQDIHNKLELGFATFFLNRCNRSGILKAGPIGGQKQNGNYRIDCRFNKDRLIPLLRKIYDNRNRIDVTNLNAEEFIEYIDMNYDNLFIYLDPPYVDKGYQLYKNSFTKEDHVSLSKKIKKLKNKWFVTYDNTDLIKELYSDCKTEIFNIQYSAGSKRVENEIAVYSDSIDNILVP